MDFGECLLGHVFAFLVVEGADGLGYAEGELGADGEFFDAEADEEGCEADVASHFAADAGPDVVLLGGLDGVFDEAEDAEVGGAVEVGDACVAAVDGDGVLDEVVGADGEEVDFWGEEVCDDGGAGDLDHDADGDVGVEWDFGFGELVHAFAEEDFGAFDFGDA